MIVDLCVYSRMFDQHRLGPFGDSLASLERWEIDPSLRKVSRTTIDERPQEFPRHNPKVGTELHRFGYTAGVNPDYSQGPVYKLDLASGTASTHDFGPGRGSGEAVFVAREGATAEDDGWLMSLVYDRTSDESELVILDARDISAAPVARVHLPRRVPFGFHGNWVPDASVPAMA